MRTVTPRPTLQGRSCPICGKPVRRSHRCRARLVPPPPGWRDHLELLPDLDVAVAHVEGQMSLPLDLPPVPIPTKGSP